MSGTFIYAPNSHVAEEIPPDEPSATSFNGWEFTSKPGVPYRRKLKLTLSGMRWIKNAGNTSLDYNITPEINAGRLKQFYELNRTWDTFLYTHEYLGTLLCRFASPVTVPKALPNSGGLIEAVEVTLIHHNPGYSS